MRRWPKKAARDFAESMRLNARERSGLGGEFGFLTWKRVQSVHRRPVAAESEVDEAAKKSVAIGRHLLFSDSTPVQASKTSGMIGEYKVGALLGKGGFGAVYLAEKDGKEYAVHCTNPDRVLNRIYGMR